MQRGAQELAKEVSRTKGVAVAMEIAAQGLTEGMDMATGLHPLGEMASDGAVAGRPQLWLRQDLLPLST